MASGEIDPIKMLETVHLLVVNHSEHGIVACTIVTAHEQPTSDRSQRRSRGGGSGEHSGDQPAATEQRSLAEPSGAAGSSSSAGAAGSSSEVGDDHYVGRQVTEKFTGCGTHHGTVIKRTADGK